MLACKNSLFFRNIKQIKEEFVIRCKIMGNKEKNKLKVCGQGW